MKNSSVSEEEIDLTLSLGYGSEWTMKNSTLWEEEIDLTLSIGYGSGRRTSIPLAIDPSQTNSNLNPDIASSSINNNNPSLVSSSNDNSNPPNAAIKIEEYVSPGAPSRRPSRRASSNRRRGEEKTIPPPFPWATNEQATIHSEQYLLENNICTITGKVHCKKCEQEFQLSLDLEEKAADLREFIHRRKGGMHDRAPSAWMKPVFPKCLICGRENSTRPVLAKDKKEINWLFLLLGQMLGCCTLDDLKHFCKHNNRHRTGAKDRLLYLTYMTLAKQLQPEWFDS
ncbi:unnamed protein product [Sphenostylis stenocarpa]|uniref:DUF7086 domain-containing protein n=1 Tax=Sphenostylis stenocarpa TaxID=92480 RepID=A0AA86S032_9FABA|nr:unnamed protein product [Sphenostylis stenocarpa]